MFLKPSVSWGAAASQDIQVEVVEFHRHFMPGTAVTQSSCSKKAAQLAGVNLSTSLSIRLLKPPYTYITLTQEETEINLEYLRRNERGQGEV